MPWVMRSRPTVTLVDSPKVVRAGESSSFRVQVRSRTKTPVEAVELRLEGVERRWYGSGKSRHRKTHRFLNQVATLTGAVLEAGASRFFEATFLIPPEAPPSYASSTSAVTYRLRVRVSVPWWLDRREDIELHVGAAAADHAPAPRPKRTATELVDDGSTELKLELAVASDQVCAGDVLRGAVAVENARHHRVARLEVHLLGVECDASSERGEVVAASYPLLSEPAPVDGLPYPFDFRLAPSLTPTFRGQLTDRQWRLEARAVIRFGIDPVESMPIVVLARPKGPAAPHGPTPPRIPLVGNERQTRIWREVAGAHSLTFEPDPPRLTTAAGRVSVQVTAGVRDGRRTLLAKLTWPSQGLDVHVAERRWLDVLRSAEGRVTSVGHAEFDGRFRVCARDDTQLSALMSDQVVGQLLCFEHVGLHDGGAELVSGGDPSSEHALNAFIATTLPTARALAEAIERIPAPVALADRATTWAAAARHFGGRFEVGTVSIREVDSRGGRVELIHRCEGEVWVAYARALRRDAARAPPWPDHVQRVVDSVRAECQRFTVTDDAVEATSDWLGSQPLRAESLWRALQRVTNALTAP